MARPFANGEAPEIRRVGRALLALHAADNCDRLWLAIVKMVEVALPHQFMASVFSYDASLERVMRTSGNCKTDRTRRMSGDGPPHPCLRITDCRPGVKLVTRETKADEAAAPDGIRYMADLVFWESGEPTAHICICRTGEPGIFTAAEKKELLALHPHIEVAIRRIGEAARQERLISLLGAALEHPSLGLVLLDRRGRIIHQNEAAENLCAIMRNGRAATVLRTKTGIVPLPECLSSAAGRLLAEYDESCRSGAVKGGHFELETVHPEGVRARLRMVAPRGRPQHRHVRIDLTKISESVNGKLHAPPWHRLSAAEIRVVELVAGGMSNHEVAEVLGLSVNTVRAHLREAFSELDVQHRGQLAGLGRPANVEQAWHFNI